MATKDQLMHEIVDILEEGNNLDHYKRHWIALKKYGLIQLTMWQLRRLLNQLKFKRVLWKKGKRPRLTRVKTDREPLSDDVWLTCLNCGKKLYANGKYKSMKDILCRCPHCKDITFTERA